MLLTLRLMKLDTFTSSRPRTRAENELYDQSLPVVVG